MTDMIDVPPAMFSPRDTPILPAVSVTTTPFTTALYPTQLGGVPVLGHAGELRGCYANDRWKPKWSGFKFPRSPPKEHGGVDIYAPRNTPIVAMIAAELEQVSDANEMGKRVHLKFRHAGIAYRFILGHLDRFEGAERSVSKGAVVGYAGCTGNAAGNQPCLVPNACGKYSTHLHLQLQRDIDGMKLDPLRALGWRLDYDTDLRDVLCSQI
ncbi:MAG: M23 family metallopeptidase [Pseudomonadota bacterium]